MTMDNDNRPTTRPGSLNSPTAWIIGAIFVVAMLAVALFYSGRDIDSSKTTSDPNTAPNVVTGSNPPQK